MTKLAYAGAALAVLVAALAGFLLGRGGGSEPESGRGGGRLIESGQFTLRAPTGWREQRDPVTVPGLVLDDSVALAPAGSSSALIVGVARADDRSLLSAPLRLSVGFAPATGAVRLGDLEALHYRDVRPLGSTQPIELFASPVRDGALTAACVGADAGDRLACKAAVATLRLTRGERYRLGADVAFAHGLDASLRELDAARLQAGGELRRAQRPSAQASAARSVAAAYASAADDVRSGSHNPASARARAGIALALDGAAGAWRRLAGAADAESRDRYHVAQFFVRSSERWVDTLVQNSVAPDSLAVTGTPTAIPTPTVTATATATATPALPGLKPCTPSSDIPFSGRGFVRLCESDDGASIRVDNISHLVLAVRFDGRGAPVPSVAEKLSDQAASYAAPTRCAPRSCTVRPGSSVQLTDLKSRDITVAPAIEDSMAVVLATGLSKELEGRLVPAAQRTPRRIAACAEGIQSVGDSQNPEELWLRALNGTGCESLIKDVLKSDDAAKRESFALNVVKKVRGATEGPLRDGLLFVLKTGIHAG